MYLYVDTCAEAREQPRVLLFRLDVFLTRSLSLSWNFFSRQGWLGLASPRAPPDHIPCAGMTNVDHHTQLFVMWVLEIDFRSWHLTLPGVLVSFLWL